MTKQNNSKTIDIHGLIASEAKIRIEKEIASSPSSIKKIIVIHGYNKGNVLQEMVRNNIRSSRIVEIIPSFLNSGISIIFLK